MGRDSALPLRYEAPLPRATQLSLRSLPFAQLRGLPRVPDTSLLITLRLVFTKLPTYRTAQLLRAQVATILLSSIKAIISATFG
jgi:hypothetical protein